MTRELHHYMDGKLVKGKSGRFGEVYNPATGEAGYVTEDGALAALGAESCAFGYLTVTVTVLDASEVGAAAKARAIEAALNATKSYTNSCTYLSVRSVLEGDIPNNAGVFRCIDVKAPEASILNPVMPAPCAARACAFRPRRRKKRSAPPP